MKSQTRQSPRIALRPTAFMAGTASAMALFLYSPLAMAQAVDAPKPPVTEAEKKAADEKAKKEAQLETVTVTGIRRGIQAAISVKKNSDSIVEAISAEDIGKLPDTSVAESIARLPGVSAQRTAGRAQQISIRGMAPDFSTALLNGREQVTTGDSRGVEFDQYPSELLGGVTIYKTPDGALVGQGLSGTVDLQTVRPLSFGKQVLAASVRGQRTGIGNGKDAEGTGDKVAFTYIDQFADRTIGVALGFARFHEEGAKNQRIDTWGGWTPDKNYNAATGAVGNSADPTVKMPGGFGYFSDQVSQTREGVAGTIQFKPNNDFETTLDLFYSRFNVDKATKGLQGAVSVDNNAKIAPTQANLANTVVSNGVATSGMLNNFKGVVRNDSEATRDELTSIGWGSKLKLSDGWTAIADLSYSSAERTGGIVETTSGRPGQNYDWIKWTGFNGSNHADIVYSIVDASGNAVNYADPNIAKITDVMGWGGGAATPQAGYSKLPHVTDKLNALRLGGRKDLDGDMFTGVDFGLNVTDRTKTRAFVEGRLVTSTTDPFFGYTVGGAGSTTVGGIPILTFDPQGLVGSALTVAAKQHPDIFNKDWSVSETVTTAFSKVDIDSQWMGLPVRGNAGVQLVHTDQSSTAFNVDKGSCANDVCSGVKPQEGGTTYNDFLPSVNLSFDMGDDSVVRFGAARVMARPTMSDMRASLGFGLNATGDNGQPILTGDSGNPELKPFRANALDLSYEKYYGNKAYWGAAAFYKSLSTYILRKDESFDYKDLVGPTTALPGSGPHAGSTVGRLTRPVNGSGGNISGVELSGSLPLNMVTSWLDGFGVVASYANTHSSIKLPTSGVNVKDITTELPLPGLSKQVASVTLYYEANGFSARWAQRYRSDFVGEVSDFTGDRTLTYIKGEKVADLQLGYEVQSGMFKGLSAIFQILNVNDAKFQRYKDTPSNVIETVQYGKTYLFGLNYKL